MCTLINEHGEQIAADNKIEIFKVVTMAYHSLVYSNLQSQYDYGAVEGCATSRGFASIKNMQAQRACGYEKGFGYMGFESLHLAQIYLDWFCKNNNYFPHNFRVVTMFIPKGVRYVRGTISDEYIGTGLSAVRAEKLGLYEKFSEWEFDGQGPWIERKINKKDI